MSEMSMERRVLQFMGAYTELQDSMQFYVYGHLSDEERQEFTKRNPDSKILDAFKKLCRHTLNVAMPEMIAATYKGAGPYRNDLAHMLKIESIEGERPNRVMRFVRYDDYTTTGEWASQNKKTIEITERQLRAWTDDLRDCRKFINVILWISGMKDWSDDAQIDASSIPWWDGRWGEPPQFGEDSYAPIGRYRASTNPREYWLPKNDWSEPAPHPLA
ncbi:hypothetical protein ACNJ7E_14990 [Rhodococcus sp. NM-2]|uniref:hypothetical protein n=1 Tax=Rhodococcus sp. NM-2 TaxID=3401174 RepID=UPI003AAC0671